MKPFSNPLIYLLVATLFIFSSCSDDEDPSRRDFLIGTWEVQSGELVDYEVSIEGTTLGRSAVQGLAAINPEIAAVDEAIAEGADVLFPPGTTIVFDNDNQYTLNDQTEIIADTWSLSDDEQRITVQTGSSVGPSELVFNIEELTDQQVRFTLDLDEGSVDLENQGVNQLPVDIDGFSIQYRFIFSKQ